MAACPPHGRSLQRYGASPGEFASLGWPNLNVASPPPGARGLRERERIEREPAPSGAEGFGSGSLCAGIYAIFLNRDASASHASYHSAVTSVGGDFGRVDGTDFRDVGRDMTGSPNFPRSLNLSSIAGVSRYHTGRDLYDFQSE